MNENKADQIKLAQARLPALEEALQQAQAELNRIHPEALADHRELEQAVRVAKNALIDQKRIVEKLQDDETCEYCLYRNEVIKYNIPCNQPRRKGCKDWECPRWQAFRSRRGKPSHLECNFNRFATYEEALYQYHCETALRPKPRSAQEQHEQFMRWLYEPATKPAKVFNYPKMKEIK